MNQGEFRQSVSRLFSRCEAWQLTDWSRYSSFESVRLNESFRRVALSPESSYADVYREALRHRQYNFVLHNFTALQFSMRGRRHDSGLTYCYFPSPFDIDFEEVGDYDLDQLEQVISESGTVIAKPYMRYDFAPDQYRECEHPAAHVHIGFHNSSRVAVGQILSPFSFGLLAIRHFEQSLWQPTMPRTEDEDERYLIDAELRGSWRQDPQMEERFLSVFERESPLIR